MESTRSRGDEGQKQLKYPQKGQLQISPRATAEEQMKVSGLYSVTLDNTLINQRSSQKVETLNSFDLSISHY